MDTFDLDTFLPYLLNQTAERTGLAFQPVYRDTFGWSRTQWRIVANLGQWGSMTASEICRRTQTEKSKVSRALAGLEGDGIITRSPCERDKRAEILSLTARGQEMHKKMGEEALAFNQKIRDLIGEGQFHTLIALLNTLRDRVNEELG